MRADLLGRLDRTLGIPAGAIEERVQDDRRQRRQQNAGLDQRVDTVCHPLLEVGCDRATVPSPIDAATMHRLCRLALESTPHRIRMPVAARL